MCGRFTLYVDSKKLNTVFHLTDNIFDYVPRFNIAPGQNIPVVTQGAGGRVISYMKWGLVPHWSKDVKIGNRLINARAETIDEKPAFRTSFRHRRCLIPADGFYEWKKSSGKKQPMYISRPDRSVFAFAGIWAQWRAPEGNSINSCSIITTGANESVREIHERMPVILDDGRQFQAWLEQDDTLELKKLLQPYSGELAAYPVSPAVNSVGYDHPHLIERVDLTGI
ncbi:SOS response-associated peptidase [Pelotomaculum propionicicum]|uniref:SOS response-associated peptidase n=1 Tax=Pelotomaculum propionicicum TaxID=258475 RepID=UPI003B82989B